MKIETFSKGVPSAMIGMLLGMGGGVLLALLFGKSPTTGVSLGMGVGFACGICFDRKQPKRTKIAVVTFFGTVLLAALAADYV
jgi:flagellar biosynthesis protein FliR